MYIIYEDRSQNKRYLLISLCVLHSLIRAFFRLNFIINFNITAKKRKIHKKMKIQYEL